jgi:tRNA (cmo5U34)-methyltransferase
MLDARQQELAKLLQKAQHSKWEYSEINAYWEALANPVLYGGNMAKWVPNYEYTHKLLLDTVGLSLPPSGHVLDLGAGSGRVAKMVMERFPGCRVTLVDGAANMLQATAQTLAAFSGRYEVVVGDFLNEGVAFPPESFDGVVSVFAICHGREIGQYARLYANLHRWLKPSGSFVCYDHVCGASDHFTLLNVAGWQEFMLQSQPAEQVEAGILSTYQEDYPLSLHQHLTLLTEAGFQAADVLYKRDILAIYAGVKG